MTEIIVAAPDLVAEPSLVAAAGSAGLKVMRRCVDASDLLACAATAPDAPVVISAGVPRMSGDLVARMNPAARRVIALVTNDQDESQVRAWGLSTVVRVGEAQATAQAIAMALSPSAAEGSQWRTDSNLGVFDTGVWPRNEPGMIVAIWGPPGAPGRTCTAIGLAEALAGTGRDVLLVDADVYAASIALMAGMVDEASGLVVACRHADNGTLNPRTLRASSRSLRPGLAVLSGIPGPDRWPDVRSGALSQLWQACRSTFEITVVDVGADLADEFHGSANPVLSTRRNAAALTAVRGADAVVCVCRPDPLGLSRLAVAYPALLAAAPQVPRVLGVVSADRSARAARQLRSTLAGIGLDDPSVRLEPVPKAVRRRIATGRLPSESRQHRREQAALRTLAGRLPELAARG